MYDLENRAMIFAINVRLLIKQIKKELLNEVDMRQLIKSSGSVGANYIEANEALGTKDFKMRLKISRKEAKESAYWLKIIQETNNMNDHLRKECIKLQIEATELRKILSSIILKAN